MKILAPNHAASVDAPITSLASLLRSRRRATEQRRSARRQTMRHLLPLLLLTALVLVGCSPGSRQVSQPSPDGKLTLVAFPQQSTNNRVLQLVMFEIRDQAGKVLHREDTRASDAMRWGMAWVSNERIELKSSDIGTYYWSRQHDGTWRKE